MEPDRKNQLKVFAVLSILGGTVAYPAAAQNESSSSSSVERTNLQKIVCFISAANRRFDYDALQTGWCTHYILIDLIVLNSEGKLLVIEQSSPALNLLTEFKKRISQAGDLAKFILAIGGVNQDSAHFSRAIEDRGRAHKVAEGVVAYAQKCGFDGVDVAWFYPGRFGGSKEDKANLVTLLQELRCQLENSESLSLTVGVDLQIDSYYNMSQINSYVDFVNIMSGDYHNPREVSHVSALYPGDTEDQSNVYSSVRAYVLAGLPPDKVVILTSSYGYLYSLRIGRQGQEVVRSVQKLSNPCVRDILELENFFTSWDHARMVPYGTLKQNNGKKWITFNNLESHQRKVEFVQKFELGGIGIFTLDQDISSERSDCVSFPFLCTSMKVLRPNLDLETLPKTVYEQSVEEPVTKACQENNADVLIRYLPNDASRRGGECVKSEAVFFGDVRYKSRRFFTDSPFATTEESVEETTIVRNETTTTDSEMSTTEETTVYVNNSSPSIR